MVSTLADKLKDSAERTGSIVSIGYDPAALSSPNFSGYHKKLPNPLKNDYNPKEVKETIVNYFKEVAEELGESGEIPGAFKPNLGYYVAFDKPKEDQYQGSEALTEVISEMKGLADVPVILDVKDADIGRSSGYYATSKLKRDVDAITVHPYMGTDSIGPFAEIAEERGQGIYVLTRTTNPGGKDFQDKELKNGNKLYEEVAKKIVEWNDEYPGIVGAVVAGNHPKEVKSIFDIFAGEEVSTLTPGIGTQGGKTKKVMRVLKEVDYDPRLTRINSSSGTMYAAQKAGKDPSNHAIWTRRRLEEMNSNISAVVDL